MKTFKARTIFRYTLVASFIALFSSLIIAEVFDTTVRHRHKWEHRTDSLLSIKKEIVPIRGDILACDGSVLATNVTYYTVRVDYASESFKDSLYLKSISAIADSMAKYFGKDHEYWDRYLHRPLKKKKEERTRCYPLVKNVTYTDYLRIRTFPFFNAEKRYECGIHYEKEVRRRNPYGKMALRSVGVVTEDSATGERHGYCGLERDLDSLLYGTPGVSRIVPVNVNTIRWVDTPAINGYNIKTTIDIKMQDIVETELENVLKKEQADWGVAILMEVETGDIKAITNLQLNRSQTRYVEGMNRAVRGFEPSSVMKPISMLIALEKGWAPNLDRMIPTGKRYNYRNGGNIEDCGAPPSAIPIWEIIERSSNIGTTKLIMPNLEYPGQFKEYLQEIGFLDPLNLPISGTQRPYIPIRGTDNGAFIDVSRMTFGYGSAIPPIYTLSFYNAIANNGRYVRPRFVTNIMGNGIDSMIPVSYIRDRIGSEKNVRIIQQMLERVVWGDHGTARREGLVRNDLVKIAGKTGTGNAIFENPVNKKTGEVRTHDEYGRPWPTGKVGTYDESRQRLTFCGYFPMEKPKYSCFVMIFNPKTGVGAAASSGVVMKEIALKMYSRGMLDNESDYKETASADKSSPVFYATNSSTSHQYLKEGFNIGNNKVFKHQPVSSGIPSVMGMGLREAVSMLERAGYNVEFEGMGRVVSQFPEAGSSIPQGETVNLKLTEF